MHHDYRPVDPPKPVDVRYRGLWVTGSLVAWRKDDDRWSGYVELQVLRDGQWFDQEDVRPAGVGGSSPGTATTR